MNLVPVIFDFRDISQKYNLCVCLTTADVCWALADEGVDDQGLSYNSVIPDDSRAPCIQRVQIKTSPSGSVLELDADPSLGSSTFTLTCYVEVPPDLKSIQGYCSLSSDARIVVRFGDAPAVEWCDGPIEMVLCAAPSHARRLTVTGTGLSGGEVATINLSGPAKAFDVDWVILNGRSGICSVSMMPAHGKTFALCALSMGKNQLKLVTSPDVTNSDACDFIIETYVDITESASTDLGINQILLWTNYQGAGKISAKLGAQLPRYLTNIKSAFDVT